MNDDEMKAAIQEAVDAAKAAMKSDIDALKAKNAELINEKKRAKEDAEAAQRERDEAAEAQKLTSTNLDEVRSTLEAKHKRELERLQRERDEALTGRNKLLIDNAIATDLVANNVAKPFHGILTQALKAQAEVKDNSALINGMPLSEYIADFLSGDDGKHYVTAPVNSGANATGSNHTVKGGWTKESFSMTEFMKLAKTDPKQANDISERLGLSYRV